MPLPWIKTLCALSAALLSLAAQEQQAPDPVGAWKGKLAASIELVLHVSAKDGSYIAKLDSPREGTYGLPVSKVTLEGRTLRFEVPALRGSYEGEFSEDGQSVRGRWRQMTSLALNFERVDPESVQPKRPQTPKRPFPYREEEVTVQHEDETGPVSLAGTLTLPEGEGPFAAAILITGSGPQNRDEELMAHRPFLVISDHLTRQGLAVLRLDDRGVGGSKGEAERATSVHFANDIQAAYRFLRERKDIRKEAIGLIGHSEGGLIAPLVASREPEVGFLVLLAGPGVPGSEVLVEQTRLLLLAARTPEEQVTAKVESNRRIYEAVRAHPEGGEARERAVREAIIAAYDALTPMERASFPQKEDFVDAQMRVVLAPWFVTFVTLDPRVALRTVKAPVLALNGSLDLQVSMAQNLEEIAKALREGGNERVTTRGFEGLNHLFQTAKRGVPGEYGRIEETIAPVVLETMATWILEVTAKR